jgi:hypothetical protein
MDDWVHDDALKNYEFWIAWKRAQLLAETEDGHEVVERELRERCQTPVSQFHRRPDETDVATSE